MKVLWVVSDAVNYSSNSKHTYNGCGWIGSLEMMISKKADVNLFVTFFTRKEEPHCSQNNEVTYYPIQDPCSSRIGVLKSLMMNEKSLDEHRILALSKTIEEIKPDIIQIFGTESFYGLVAKYTNIPIILHIQGVLNPCFNSLMPPFLSWLQYPMIGIKTRHKFLRLFDKKNWEYKCRREKEIFRLVSNYMGRTKWDRSLTMLYNPNANYYECWEMLRSVFYKNGERTIPTKLIVCSTVSNTTYKGVDVILKTAQILKQELSLDFEWYVYGGVNMTFFEKLTKIKAKSVNVIQKGIASANEVMSQLLSSTVYVHPSYIDNSSNSVCEAMILGCPVIASNVGGLNSLIEDNETGLLAPPNDPFLFAIKIKEIYEDYNLNKRLGERAKEVALNRHNPLSICDSVIKIYNNILAKKN